MWKIQTILLKSQVKTLTHEMDRYFTSAQNGFRRAMRQFGVMIPAHINAGIGGSLRFGPDVEIGILYPDHFLNDDEEDVTIAGLKNNQHFS